MNFYRKLARLMKMRDALKMRVYVLCRAAGWRYIDKTILLSWFDVGEYEFICFAPAKEMNGFGPTVSDVIFRDENGILSRISGDYVKVERRLPEEKK